MSTAISHVLTDSGNGTWVESFEVSAKQLGRAGDWYVRKRTLHGGLSDGVDVIEVNNGRLSFSVVPTRGMGVWRGLHGTLPIAWCSPVKGPVNPAFINEHERGGLGWLRGFDEVVVRCGLESNGAPCSDVIVNNMGQRTEVPVTLHGRIANAPASYVEVQVSDGDRPEIAVVGRVEESGLFLPRLRLTARISTVAGANGFTIDDEVTNLRGVEDEMELLYHCNFGPPFLEAGSVLEVPARMVAPRDARAAEDIETCDTYRGPTAGYVEQCYWYEPLGDDAGDTCAMLRNATGNAAVVVRFNRNELPCFTQWKNTASVEDGYVTGLEPATNYPNAKPFERSQGRVVQLPAGGSYRARVVLEVLDSVEQVTDVHKQIEALQTRAERVVHPEPRPGYSDV
jgi:hypothetical protein